MANTYTSLSSLFTDIADAIREKTGDTETIVADDFPDVIRERLQVAPPKPYLTFRSPNSFTLAVGDATKHWDGTLEYSTDTFTWSTWDGTTTLSSATTGSKNALYLRGTGNTVITGNSSNYKWVLTGTDVKCNGNIENLLDYATVESGNHPTMADYCYYWMFSGCTSLTQAPALPATALASSCYEYMFRDCTGLTQAPELPATTLSIHCYRSMFSGCTSLTQAPALPATALTDYCYNGMFYKCTGLTQAPALPATTLAIHCYDGMFYKCTGLTQAPELPATTLAVNCYSSMFRGCTSLTQAPALPATALASSCYEYMFRDCTGLTQAPELPATTLESSCYYWMFSGCAKIKLSTTQTGEYTDAYRIPSSGTGTTATMALNSMFTSTGGTFTGTPEINTTYYLSVPNTEKPYLKFISPNEFFIGAYNQGKTWDGTLEYSTDKITWTEWDGTSDMNADASNGEYVLYLRGTGNSKIGDCFYSEGTDVRCIGNIENILDYTVVSEGGHPTMGEYCFSGLFDESNTPTNWLIQAPELLADKLSVGCYMSMFLGCKKLTAIPSLPAHGDGTLEGDEMPHDCYSYMFSNCTSIKLSETNTGEYTQEYRIPATGTYGSGSMDQMFDGTGGTFTGTPSINTTYYLSNTNEIV